MASRWVELVGGTVRDDREAVDGRGGREDRECGWYVFDPSVVFFGPLLSFPLRGLML